MFNKESIINLLILSTCMGFGMLFHSLGFDNFRFHPLSLFLICYSVRKLATILSRSSHSILSLMAPSFLFIIGIEGKRLMFFLFDRTEESSRLINYLYGYDNLNIIYLFFFILFLIFLPQIQKKLDEII